MTKQQKKIEVKVKTKELATVVSGVATFQIGILPPRSGRQTKEK